MEPATPSPQRGHRRQRSLTKSQKPTPVPKYETTGTQLNPLSEMTTYINYGAMLEPFSGKSKDNQDIVDFIEAIESQADLQCNQDESKAVKLKLRLFRTNLRGDARDMMNMLTPAEKDDWEQVKKFYIAKYKTERDRKAKQRAREAMASFKQRVDEPLKAYGERAVKLRQLIEVADEGFLVSRFLRGVRDKNIRQMIAVGQEDMSKLTVAQINQRILNLTGAGSESGSDDESEDSEEESDSSYDEDYYKRKKKKKGKAKVDEKALKKATQKLREEMEEKFKTLKAETANRGEVLAVQTAYQGTGNNQQGRATDSGQGGGYTCYNCGMQGHMARFCPDRNHGRATRNGAGATILFPVDGGTQKMIWVDYPPKGLPPGYYPVVENASGNRRGGLQNKPPAASEGNTGRITEVQEVTYVDVVSSAAEKMAIGKAVVKYVNAVEDAYVTGRRRRNESDGGSSDAPPRQRGRPAAPTTLQGGIRLGERVSEEPRAQHGESAAAAEARAEPIDVQTPPRIVVENSVSEAVESERPAPVPKRPAQRKAKRGAPKPPRPIRMMIGRPGFDIVAEFRDLRVTNMKWGTLMDMAPALRRQIGAGLLLERRERKAKGKAPAQADAMDVNAMSTTPDWKVPCVNFFTSATLQVNGKRFEIGKVMIDPGSVVNLASIEVLEKIGTPLFPVEDLTIRTATSALTKIRYYSDVDTIVAGVKTKIRIYAMPREFVLSYGLLLSRRWLCKVRARGNYERDTYIISDEAGEFKPVPRYHEQLSNTVDIPRIGYNTGNSNSTGIDRETREDLDLLESGEETDEDVIRNVIGQATRAMRGQSSGSSDNSYDEADSEEDWEESGNVSDF